MARDISKVGLDFIKRHEGFRGQLYNDPTGNCTIGIGHKLHDGPCNRTAASERPYLGGITEAAALDLLEDDAQFAVRAVNEKVKVPLTQNQFDALVSFTFNVGAGNDGFGGSTLLIKLNKGEYDQVRFELSRWTNGGLPGLVRRRQEEADLFEKRELHMLWKGAGTDTRLWRTGFDGAWKAQKQVPSSAGASAVVALAAFRGKLHAAWKGQTGDSSRIWWNTFDGRVWGHEQMVVPAVGTSFGPALAVFKDKLFMAWKGKGSDVRIWWTAFNGSAWEHQQQLPNVGASHGPSLAVYNGKLYAAWKGQQNDKRLWSSAFDGRMWTHQQQLPGGTQYGPALVAYNGKLYAAWRGRDADTAIWWSEYDGRTWRAQRKVAGVGTSLGPSLSVFRGKIYMAWKGRKDAQTGKDDPNIWWTTYDGRTWDHQHRVTPAVGASHRPAIAEY